jgi:2-aminoadipate transaminase
MSRILAVKSDGGTGALEQMVLAEYCTAHFDTHLRTLNKALEHKASALMEALAEQFGTAAEFERPAGGIFLWVTLPGSVDTSRLFQVAAEAGIALNPGTEWSIAGAPAKRKLRLCFANPSLDVIRSGVAALAAVCHKEFGVPERIGNVRAGT